MSSLSLALLGPMSVTLDGHPVNLKYDKVRALLAYLAVETDRPHRRDALLGLLWPDLPQAAARNNLRQALATLRDALSDRSVTPPFLLVDRTEVQFNPTANCWLDVAIFTGLLAACTHHAHRRAESCKACADRLQQAVTLYRGSFLAEFFLPDSDTFEAWAVVKREQLQQHMLTALAQLVVYQEQRGHYAKALTYARRQLELEPWHEEAHRQAMRLYLLNGDRSAALAQYAHCQRVLAAELGVEPEAATTVLYNQIAAAGDETPLATAHLAAPSDRPHTLPPQPTPFIGREQELAALGQLLADPACRLVTLTGPGGIGKTRLALQAATEQCDDYADGVYCVSLEGLHAAELLADAIANELHLEESATVIPKAHLLAHLRNKEMLLVLDNVEHLLDGMELLVDILQQAPEVTLLVTSRERLNLQGEWVFVVQGLPVPQQPLNPASLPEELALFVAVVLFVQRARRVQREFRLTSENAAGILQICQLTAGLPLALELAAAWVRALTCQEIAAEIERGIGFLTTNLRDIPERHRSLTAVFNHSWQLLTGEEQAVLRRLSVFGGSFGREAAEQVAGASLPILATLVDKSLLSWNPIGRYTIHALVRQHAAEQLQAAAEEVETNAHYLGFYLEFAEMAEQQINGPAQTLWLDRLETENDNLRAALAWSMKGDVEAGLRLAVALYPFWYWHSHFSEGRRWLAIALEKTVKGHPASTPLQAKALWASGVLAEMQGDHPQSAKFYEESLVLRRALDDKIGLAASLNSLGTVLYRQQEYAQAQAFFDESLALRRVYGQKRSLAIPLSNLGLTALTLGDYTRAGAHFEESLALAREMGDQGGVATVLCNLGTAMLAKGEAIQAHAYFVECLALQQTVMDKDGVAACLEGIAAAAVAQEQQQETARRSARLLGAAEALRSVIGAPILPLMKPFYDRTVAALHTVLDEQSFAAAWAAGCAMSLEQAIADALASPLLNPDAPP